MKPLYLFAAALLMIGGLATTAGLAGEPSVTQSGKVNISTFGRVAIEGYDPVAYFTVGRPVKGDKVFTHEWNGAVWRFADAANRDAFKADPAKYAPQYGGFCAWGVKKGALFSIDPDAWSIVDGKLYLNYNTSVRETWAKDIPAHIREADGNWPGLK